MEHIVETTHTTYLLILTQDEVAFEIGSVDSPGKAKALSSYAVFRRKYKLALRLKTNL